MDTNTPNWSSLPTHLLSLIAKHLHERIDILCFRAVCSSFLNSIPCPPKPISPLTDLKIPVPAFRPSINNPTSNPNSNTKLLLTQSTIYAIQPLNKISDGYRTTKTWILRVRESNSEKVQLQDPFYKFAYKNVSKKLPDSLNLLDYRVKKLTEVYGLISVDVDRGIELSEFHYPFFKKVVVSSSLDEIDDGFMVMGIYTGGKLGAWRKRDEEWTTIDLVYDRVFFEDVVYHNEKFYALSSKGHTVTVDPRSLGVSEVSAPMGNGNFKYLVKSPKDLFLVDKHLLDDFFDFGLDDNSYPVHLNVFKLDEEKHQWVQVMNDLGDRVLFCSSDCSFSISAKEFAGCKKNCVYFTHDAFDEVNDDHPGWDAGIFDMEDDTVGKLADLPGYSQIFWPPPAWLKRNS